MAQERMTRKESQDRRRDAAELRLKGVGYQAIADQLGFRSVSSAYEAVQKGLRENVREPANSDIVQLEVDRIDAVLEAVMKKALRGQLTAVDRMLKLQDRRSKYLGLDAAGPAAGAGQETSAVASIAAARARRRANAAGRAAT